MEVIFYFNQSDYRTINKTLVGGSSYIGQARDEADVINPFIRFEDPSILNYNYAYIPQFNRYYTVTEITAFREGIWDVSLKVDVLMSFRGDILNLGVVVDKQSMRDNGDEYIDDASLVADNVEFITTYNFENGFNDNPLCKV